MNELTRWQIHLACAHKVAAYLMMYHNCEGEICLAIALCEWKNILLKVLLLFSRFVGRSDHPLILREKIMDHSCHSINVTQIIPKISVSMLMSPRTLHKTAGLNQIYSKNSIHRNYSKTLNQFYQKIHIFPDLCAISWFLFEKLLLTKI